MNNHESEKQVKQCPKCQQTFPDNAPDFCPNDGTRMTANAQPYAPAYQQPYGAPPAQQNWPPPPQPPPQNWTPPAGGYYPPAGQSPYAPRAATGGGLGKAAMWLGLVSLLLTAFFFTIVVMIQNGNFDLLDFAQPSYYAMVALGIIGLVLGIVALVKSGGSKGKAIIGICTSLPAVLFFIYVIVTTGRLG